MQSQGSMVSHLWHCLSEELIVLPDGLRLFRGHLCRGGNKKTNAHWLPEFYYYFSQANKELDASL